MGMGYVIEGAQVLLPEGLVAASVTVEGDRIAGLDSGTGRRIDGRGLILAPALIDVHGDAFEREMMPRPGVFVPIEGAVLSTDRLLASNGIATAYHALTLSWEPGLRSVEQGRRMVDALTSLGPRLTVENRLQLRWETFAFEAAPLIEEALQAPLTPSLAFNDHTSMSLRDRSVPIQDRLFEQDPDYVTIPPSDPDLPRNLAENARRSGLTPEAYVALLGEIWERRAEVPAMIARLAGAARAVDAPMFSHDDTQDATRDYYRELGARVAEFPMRVPVAEAARAAGDAIIFGAPNALRGGSHIGSPSASEMAKAGLCDGLASDYHYPAMLAAVARMRGAGEMDLPALWHLVSRGPALASGLSDRGEIRIGLRADLVLLDWPEPTAPPAVVMTLSGGRIAYLSRDLMG